MVVLLHRAADSPAARVGLFDYQTPHPDGFLRFGFRAVRVWEQNAGDLLAGDLAILPLAPISNVKRDALPEVVRAMESRLGAEATAEQSGIFWPATYLLLGLRYKPAFINELLKGVRQLKECSTYQFILAEAKGRAEGRTEGERAVILQLGRKRFGPPDAATQATLDAITSTEQLERLAGRLLESEEAVYQAGGKSIVFFHPLHQLAAIHPVSAIGPDSLQALQARLRRQSRYSLARVRGSAAEWGILP